MMKLQTIIKGCINNDDKCQRALYHMYYDYAFKIAFRYIYQYKHIADVVNGGFVKLFTNNNSFLKTGENNIEQQLQTVIKRTIIHAALNELRLNKFKPYVGSYPQEIWEEPINSHNAATMMQYKQLICCVKSLPPVCGVVYNMYMIDGFLHKEIARQLGITITASQSYVCKAKVYLEKLIKKEMVYSTI
jgi:RNA polymerase sigma factor (sigma-70 family)